MAERHSFVVCLTLLAWLFAPATARAQAPQASTSQSASAPEPSRFAVGGSLTGAFGRDSWLMPAVRTSVQLSPRIGLDVDMGSSARASDRTGLAPRGFTSAFALRIGSRPDENGGRKYVVIGSRTIREGYPDDRFAPDTFASPFLGFGIDRRQPHIRAAGEIGVTGAGLKSIVLLLGFCVQWAPR